MTTLGGMCNVCEKHKEIPCVLPNGDYLCHECMVEAVRKRHADDEMGKKRAVIEAKLSVLVEIELKCRMMHEEILRELEGLGLSVEAQVEFLLKNGRKFAAMKLHQDAHGCTLAEAKKYVDDLENR